MRRYAGVLLLLSTGFASAADYDVTVTRKDSNLYKVAGKDLYIQTRYCYEYVYSEDSLLRMSGNTGKIVFLDEGSSCDVKGVYGDADPSPGKYSVTVNREDDDWYEIWGTDSFVKTSMCLNLALGEAAILKVSAGGYGTLIFVDDGDSCSVEGVYSKLRL